MRDPSLLPPNITPKPALPNAEQTTLTPINEILFRQWAKANGIQDVDDPEAHYDYRGLYQATNGAMVPPGSHFPDTFKQHGHETFSQESIYSKGPPDGGIWIGSNHDVFLPQPPMAVSHESPATTALINREGRK